MLATVVCAVLCGARGYAAIAEWLHQWPVDFCHRLGYLRRPPKKGAFRNLLMALAAERFERAISDGMSQVLGVTLSGDELQAVSIDGQWLRGTRDAQDRLVVLLAAFDHQTGGVFAQHRVPEGTNEAQAVLELLEHLILKGRIVTADAAFCSPDISEAIVHQEGHYVLAVKDHQPILACPARRPMPRVCWRSIAAIAESRTARSTSATKPSAKTAAVCEREPPRKSWPPSATRC